MDASTLKVCEGGGLMRAGCQKVCVCTKVCDSLGVWGIQYY